jgi:peptidoglycan/LPS O-acetylase OafA/YrhL
MLSKSNHYISLDLFRGFCGYGVAICHLNAFAFSNVYMEYMSLLFAEFFFVLSGFVLYPQLIKVLHNKKNLIIFYKRRWMRTLPLYITVLILISILTGHLYSWDFLKYLTLIQKSFPEFLKNDYYPVVWHLSIEEFFYLIFPLIIITSNNENFISRAIYIFGGIIIVKIFFSYIVDANFFRTGTLLRFDAILLGFIIAHFKNYLLSKKKLIFFSFIFFTSVYLFNSNFFIDGRDVPYLKFIFILLMQVTSTVVMLVFILMEPLITNKNFRKFSLLISEQAYSIYLFHMILIYILKKLNYSVFFSSSLYIILCFLISTLVYKFFEKPIMKLRPKIIN